MQHSSQIDFESRLNSLMTARLGDLRMKLHAKRIERLLLYKEYLIEDDNVKILMKVLTELNEEIHCLCNMILEIKLNITRRSEALFAAILENMFIQKKIINEIFFNVSTAFSYVQKGFEEFDSILSKISSYFLCPEIMIQADNVLTKLRTRIAAMNEMGSEYYENCFQFLCTIQETLKKIQHILER